MNKEEDQAFLGYSYCIVTAPPLLTMWYQFRELVPKENLLKTALQEWKLGNPPPFFYKDFEMLKHVPFCWMDVINSKNGCRILKSALFHHCKKYPPGSSDFLLV